jgi:cell division protease FtsH
LIVEALLLLETIVKKQIDYIHKNLKLPEEAIEKQKQNKKLDEEKHEEKIEAKEAAIKTRKSKKPTKHVETPTVIELPEKTPEAQPEVDKQETDKEITK